MYKYDSDFFNIIVNKIKYNLGIYSDVEDAIYIRKKTEIIKSYILNYAGLISNDFEKLVWNKAWNSFIKKLRQHEPKAMSNIVVRGNA